MRIVVIFFCISSKESTLVMIKNIKKFTEALNILKDYNGVNPYILMLKRDFFIGEKLDKIDEFQVEYILKNKDFAPKPINKVIKITKWYGENRKEAWNLDFVPEKILIVSFLGETQTIYNCYVQYRQSVPPVMCFLPKKAILNNFFVEDYHKLNVDFDRYDRLSMSKDPNRKLKEHQKEGVQFLLSRKRCILADEQGVGKMEPVSSLIPTPNGFKKMGDINPGDKVFSSDGKIYNVLKTFDHKNKEIYRVTFNDGTYVDCGLEHLWVVRDCNRHLRGKGWKVSSLDELIKSGLTYNDNLRKEKGLKPRNKYEIPVCEPVEYTEKKYLIHPYILGMCIGDGNLCNNGIHISIPDNERENAERIETLLPEYMFLKEDRSSNCPRYSIQHKKRKYTNDFVSEIRRLELNVLGNYKFIPEEYKLGSFKQRLDLLRGLMDSDGTISKTRNRIGYCTNSEKLAKDVKELVFSLGGIAKIRSYDRRSSGKNIEYIVTIQIKVNPFYLKRKAERYKPTFKKYCHKYIVSAEYVRNEDARCLMVDSIDHTYLTSRNYVVTHNTTELSVAAIEGNFDSVLIICPASLKTNWKRELLWYTEERYITIIESFNDKKKNELEAFLGYSEGRSNKKREELLQEAKEAGKWQDNRFIIINYDVLDDFFTFSRATSEEGMKKALEASPILKYIYNKKSCIIMDEAHYLSNNTSNRYKVIKNLIKKGNPECVWLATGTPVTNNPLNLYYLLSLIENEITADYEYYINTFCDARKIPAKGEKERCTNIFLAKKEKETWYDLTWDERDELKKYIDDHARKITIATGSGNLDELEEKVRHIYLRRTKEDIGLTVTKTIHEIYYNLTSSQKTEYEKLWGEYEQAQLELDPEKEINKDLLEGGIYRRYLSNIMVPKTIKLADSIIARGDKVVIACCYDEELNMLKEYYGDKCVIHNGKMLPKQKDKSVERFNTDNSVKVFIGNIISAGKGLTLVVSHDLIFNNINYTRSDNSQMEDRIHRIGQTHDCDIYYQLFKDTQYENMWNIVLRKETITNSIVKTETEKS